MRKQQLYYCSMKQIPNLITSVRLISAVLILALCAFAQYRGYFVPLFIAAGASDMLDGFIARRCNWCTEFGAKLDSVSDLTLYASVLTFLVRYAGDSVRQALPLLLIGLFTQAFHLVLSVQRMRQFPAYHTTFSRISAYMIFAGVLYFWSSRTPNILDTIFALWTLCSLEGMVITLLLPEARTNVSSIIAAVSASRNLVGSNHSPVTK